MTPKIIELKHAPVVLVELPERPVEVKDSYANGFIYKDKTGYIESEYLEDYCDWEDSKLVGILSDLTEEQFAEWAVKYPGNATTQRYVNHAHKDKSAGMQVSRVSSPSTYRASDSCLSLLESENVYTENPYGAEEPESCRCMGPCGRPCRHVDWMEAQDMVIDPARTVVLIRKEDK